jgi:hypothetical protein
MSRSLHLILCCFLVFAMMSFFAYGQTPSGPTQKTDAPPQAKEADVNSIEHIVAALYSGISGPAGPRDWDRVRSLFYAGARMIPSRRTSDGKVIARNLSVEEYITASKPILDKEGFFETPITNRIETWDHIAHVWSTYQSRHEKDEAPFARGINSIELMNDGTRWWIITVYWEGEEKDHPLPEKYLND